MLTYWCSNGDHGACPRRWDGATTCMCKCHKINHTQEFFERAKRASQESKEKRRKK